VEHKRRKLGAETLESKGMVLMENHHQAKEKVKNKDPR
jgi:hypothetical protein